MLIPGFCRRVFEWWALAAYLETGEQGITAEWTAPRREMLNPREEVVAQTKRIRGGLISHPEALRQDGHDPEAVLEEIAAWNARIDELGIVLDTDPRNTGQSGQTQAQPAANDAGDGDGDGDEEDQEDSDGTEEQDTDD
jgi:capsid protein